MSIRPNEYPNKYPSYQLDKYAEDLTKKEKLTCNERINLVACEICKKLNLNSNTNVQKVIHALWEVDSDFDVSLYLKSLFIANPSFQLSPCDQLCKEIVEDKVTTNETLQKRFRELSLNENDQNLCYKVAYHMRNLNIYQAPEIPVAPEKYTINLLWINREAHPKDNKGRIIEKNHIFGDGQDDTMSDKFINKIKEWAKENPDCKINLWYDATLYNQATISNTWDKIFEIEAEFKINNLIRLQNIRALPQVRNNKEMQIALDTENPVYFRVDLCKSLIADNLMKNDQSSQYCVITDVDMPAMKNEKLFDRQTFHFLEEKGYVICRNKNSSTENSFMIFNKEITSTVTNHYNSIISPIIALYSGLISGSQVGGAITGSSCYQYFLKFLEKKEERGTEKPRKNIDFPDSQFSGHGKTEADSSSLQMDRIPYIAKKYLNPNS